uniref:Histone chaperone domain-containing protein n=1 Tax=Gouania willdenowi TaxID=441366 RepID=A0A8C5ETF4_GOUWI
MLNNIIIIIIIMYQFHIAELTLGILRKRYLTHAGCDSLSPEVKQKFKQVVEEELIRMQVFVLDMLYEEGEDEEQNKSGSNKKKQDSLKPQPEENKRSKEMSSKDSSDDEIINDSDEGQTVTPRKEAKINSGSEESISEADAKSEKGDTNSDSSDDQGKKAATKKSNDSDSDSSQITSDDDKPVKKEEKTTKKNGAKKEGRQPSVSNHRKSKESSVCDGEKAVNRLKHYITLCGARKNYKKLFEGCKSVSSQLNILRKVLEDLGVHGNPSIKKCKKAKKKLERAQELADLDLSNIITTKGRPKRGGAWQKQADPLPSTYQRAMNSGSDSDQEDNGTRRRRRVTEWDNLRGIISDDGDSD